MDPQPPQQHDVGRAQRSQAAAFCKRWLQKADAYDLNRLEDAFDSFFTLFVAFNRLYFHFAQSIGKGNVGDQKAATSSFAQAIGHATIWQFLTRDGGEHDIQTLRELIAPGGPFFVISGPDPTSPDEQGNRELCERLESSSERTRVEAVLMYLYRVRCNMFHGRKEIDGEQLGLLQGCNRCLRRVVDAGLSRLGSSDAELV